MPSAIGIAISVPIQLMLLVGLFGCFLGDLQSCCHRKGRTAALLLAGMCVAMSLRLMTLLITDDGTYGAMCRQHYRSNLPDGRWITADFIEHGLFGFGSLGLIATWLATRYWAGGIRPDKTTTGIAGVSLGLAIGAALEYSQVALGHVRAMNPARLIFFALLGGFLAIVSRPFLVRRGRFQFGLKNLFALTAVWALIFGLLSPQWSSYQSETDAMSSLAALLGGPVRCARTEGLVGLARVDFIDLPPCKIDDTKLDAIIAQLKRLPRLRFVNTKTATLGEQGLKRLRNALPGVVVAVISSTEDRSEEILPGAPQAEHKSERGGN